MLSPPLDDTSAGSTMSSSAVGNGTRARFLEGSDRPRLGVEDLGIPEPWKWEETEEGEERGMSLPPPLMKEVLEEEEE